MGEKKPGKRRNRLCSADSASSSGRQLYGNRPESKKPKVHNRERC